MKRTIAVVGAIALTGFLAACGDDSDDDQGPGSGSAADDETGAADEPDTDDVDKPDTGQGTDEQAGGERNTAAGDWKEVVGERRALTYDVPADWTVAGPDLMYGFEGEEGDADTPTGHIPTVTMSDVATYRERDGGCIPAHGQVGTNGLGEAGSDTAVAAVDTAIRWAELAYRIGDEKPDYEDPVVEPFEVNGLSGHYAIIDVTPVRDECHPEKAEVRVASFDSPSGDDVYNIIIYADTSGDHAPDRDDLDAIIASIRPSGG